MKINQIVSIAALLFAASALGQTTPPDLKGLTLNTTLRAAIVRAYGNDVLRKGADGKEAMNRFVKGEMAVDAFRVYMTFDNSKTITPTIADKAAAICVVFKTDIEEVLDSRLYQITIYFSYPDYEDIYKTLIAKYGPPVEISLMPTRSALWTFGDDVGMRIVEKKPGHLYGMITLINSTISKEIRDAENEGKPDL